MRSARALFTAAWIASLLALSASARADDDAESLIARGIELREKGKDDEALALFKRAYAKAPSPRARAQVALAEQALGLWVAAESDLIESLSAGSDPWIVKNRAALEGALAVVRRHVGSLEVRGTDGAEIVLDGVLLGTLPSSPFRVEAGRRTLEIRAKGFHATTRAIEVPPGGIARESVTLVELPPEGEAAPAAPASHVGESGDAGRGQRLLGWVFVGTGGALLATGGVGMLVRKSTIDDYNDACPGLGAPQSGACEEKIDAARTWLTVSIVSFVAGGVFAAGGATLLVTAPSAGSARAGWRFACGPSGMSVSCAGTF
ncbi:MAG: hypothetical protein KF819_00905 [Labilithrix sp.]|nr:hypothetical protein [Labilithrix sp.]